MMRSIFAAVVVATGLWAFGVVATAEDLEIARQVRAALGGADPAG